MNVLFSPRIFGYFSFPRYEPHHAYFEMIEVNLMTVFFTGKSFCVAESDIAVYLGLENRKKDDIYLTKNYDCGVNP